MTDPRTEAERISLEITDDWMNQEPVIPDVLLSEVSSEYWQRLRTLIAAVLVRTRQAAFEEAAKIVERNSECYAYEPSEEHKNHCVLHLIAVAIRRAS